MELKKNLKPLLIVILMALIFLSTRQIINLILDITITKNHIIKKINTAKNNISLENKVIHFILGTDIKNLRIHIYNLEEPDIFNSFYNIR